MLRPVPNSIIISAAIAVILLLVTLYFYGPSATILMFIYGFVIEFIAIRSHIERETWDDR